MYNPEVETLIKSDFKITSHYLNANNHFWNIHLKTENVRKLLDNLSVSEEINPAYSSILNYKDYFCEKVSEAQIQICDCNNSPQQFFAYLETLNLVCRLYSEYVYFPYTLTLQDGFLTENNNSKKMWEECTIPAKNPYLEYITQNIFPLIEKYEPQIIFLEGSPNYYNIGISKLVKQKMPNTTICITRHSSEYYSLNKIDYLLKKNNYFFKFIDIVILEYFSEIEKEIINGTPLNQINNILYKDKDNNIIQNDYHTPCNYKNIFYQTRRKSKYANFYSDPSKLANVHLEPYTKCFWNRCSFCGINKKYHFENNDSDVTLLSTRLEELKELILSGVSYVWFVDEAISTTKLKKIAQFFVKQNLSVIWQVRTRICKELTNDSLIKLLKNSGLKEIRLGLESASISVLKKMNKIDEFFSLDLVECICMKFNQNNISVHFPIIIGFPGETTMERRRTYAFLRHLHEKYPLVTFNINLFGLDVSSPMFSNWTNYEIKNIYFPCIPDYFIANIVGWSGENNFTSNSLSIERDKIMKDVLYPWMPQNSITRPYIFYRLSETIRNTLYWKENFVKNEKTIIDEKCIIIKNENVTISYQQSREIYIIYNWSNHHYMIGNENTLKIFDIFRSPITIDEAIEKLCLIDALFQKKDLEILIYKLISLDFFELYN